MVSKVEFCDRIYRVKPDWSPVKKNKKSARRTSKSPHHRMTVRVVGLLVVEVTHC